MVNKLASGCVVFCDFDLLQDMNQIVDVQLKHGTGFLHSRVRRRGAKTVRQKKYVPSEPAPGVSGSRSALKK